MNEHAASSVVVWAAQPEVSGELREDDKVAITTTITWQRARDFAVYWVILPLSLVFLAVSLTAMNEGGF